MAKIFSSNANSMVLCATIAIIIVVTLFHSSRRDQSFQIREDAFFDIVNWQKNNMDDFRNISNSVFDLIRQDSWPKVFNFNTDINISNDRRTESDNDSRRRLGEHDNWEREEKEMMTEMKSFYNNMKVKYPSMKQDQTVVDSEEAQNTRLLEDFPRFSPNCTDPSSEPPCPPENLPKICDKYNGGKFEDCFQLCKLSFCCTHDSKSQLLAPSCADALNCRNWIPCYIAWWKISDTVGPAPYLRVPQEDDFFDVPRNYIQEDTNEMANEEFYLQVFNRFRDDDQDDGFDDYVFFNQENWENY